jgi:uncharacterized damage-inducible protein DinB
MFVNVIDHLRRQFTYDEWANREVLAAIRTVGDTSGRPIELMAHILSAERLWLERLQQHPQTLPVWPKSNLDQCEAQAGEMGRLWRDYLARLVDDDLSKLVSYKNSKGEAWTSTVVDILTHAVMHSAYHRGQIASHIRASGQTPAYTDYIHGVRQGLVK